MSAHLPNNDRTAVLTLLLYRHYLQLTDQLSDLVEAVAILALHCRQHVADVGEEAEQVLHGGGEVPPLSHQPIDVALPLPDTLGSTLPPLLQFCEL